MEVFSIPQQLRLTPLTKGVALCGHGQPSVYTLDASTRRAAHTETRHAHSGDHAIVLLPLLSKKCLRYRLMDKYLR